MSNVQPAMVRLSNDVFIMAHHVVRVVAEEYEDEDGCGVVYIYGTDNNCGTVERENDTYLPVRELAELISRAVLEAVRKGDDIDLRPRMLKPRY